MNLPYCIKHSLEGTARAYFQFFDEALPVAKLLREHQSQLPGYVVRLVNVDQADEGVDGLTDEERELWEGE